MTPVGHLSVSYISGKSWGKLSLPAIIIGGVLPDADFLLIFLEWFNQIHRVITHNLFLVMVTDFGPKYVVFRDTQYAVTSYKSREICPHDDD
jgi:membrane-bound metal-dependent hydrolase YbcI (DUF457 family)